MTRRQWPVTVVLCLASLIVLMQASKWQAISIVSSVWSPAGADYQDFELARPHDINGLFRVRVQIELHSYSSRVLHIIPDDRLVALQLNGKPVSLAGLSPEELQNGWLGFDVRLDALDPDRINTLELLINNDKGPGGVIIKSTSVVDWFSGTLIGIALLILVFALRAHLRLAASQYVVLALSLLLCTAYLSETAAFVRSFDVHIPGGHRDYIEHLVDQHSLPDPASGREYHQPPLYYVSAALVKELLVGSNSTLEYRGQDFWAQLLALYLWTIFLVASLAVLRIAFRHSPYALLCASVALCLWPSGFIHSVRVGNDLPLYAFYALGFFYTLRWWRSKRLGYLVWAGIWASMALLSKSNALSIWGVLGILLLVHAWRAWSHRDARPEHFRRTMQAAILLSLLFAATLALNLADNVRNYMAGDAQSWLLSNSQDTLPADFLMRGEPKYYLLLDLPTFVREPFMDSMRDALGRQYFWNYVMRTSLSSAFIYPGRLMKAWGMLQGLLLLLMLAGTVLSAMLMRSNRSRQQRALTRYRNLPWLLALFLPIAMLLALWIKLPYAFHADFRFIYPMLVPLLYFASRAWGHGQRWRWGTVVALVAPSIGALSLVWLSALLFLPN